MAESTERLTTSESHFLTPEEMHLIPGLIQRFIDVNDLDPATLEIMMWDSFNQTDSEVVTGKRIELSAVSWTHRIDTMTGKHLIEKPHE